MTERPNKTTFGQRLGVAFVAFLKSLLRLTAVLGMVAILRAVMLYAIPTLFQEYLNPVQSEAAAPAGGKEPAELADAEGISTRTQAPASAIEPEGTGTAGTPAPARTPKP